MADPTYYYPERTYHDLNEVSYPDHSRTLTGMDNVIRAFWQNGEQMWDEDFENNREWLNFWQTPYVFWRSEPRWPWYSPTLRLFVSEPDKCTVEPWISAVPRAFIFDGPGPNDEDKCYRMWPGSRGLAIAEGVYFGCWGANIQGLCRIQEYLDEIEIAMFFSETRKGKFIGGYECTEPFRLHEKSYSSRVRNWSYIADQLEVWKNDLHVGYIRKYMYSSGLVMFGDIDFGVGDWLRIRAPDTVGVRYGVTISIVGELL